MQQQTRPTFVEWLNNVSLAAGYSSTTALAQRLGVSQSTVSRWKTRSARPGIDHLVKLSKLFKVELTALLVIADYIDPEAADVTPESYYPEPSTRDTAVSAGVLAELEGDQSEAIYRFWNRRLQEEETRLQEALEMTRGVAQFGADPAVIRRHWPRLLSTDLSKHVSDLIFGILSTAVPNVLVPHSEGILDSDIDLLRSGWAVSQGYPMGLASAIRVIRDREGFWRFELCNGRGDPIAWSQPFASASAAMEASQLWHEKHPHVMSEGKQYR